VLGKRWNKPEEKAATRDRPMPSGKSSPGSVCRSAVVLGDMRPLSERKFDGKSFFFCKKRNLRRISRAAYFLISMECKAADTENFDQFEKMPEKAMAFEKIDDAALDAEYVLVVTEHDAYDFGIILVPCGSDVPVCFEDVMVAEAPRELPPDVKEIICGYMGRIPSWTVPYLCACGRQAINNGGPWDGKYQCAACRVATYPPAAEREYSAVELAVRNEPIFFKVSVVFNPRRREPPYWWHRFTARDAGPVTATYAERHRKIEGENTGWTVELRDKAGCPVDIFSGLLFS